MLDWFVQIEWFENYYVNREWLIYTVPKKCWTVYKKWRFLKPYVNKSRWWYCYVWLKEWNKRKNLLHHRIVANAFIPKVEWKPEINHKDWNKSNNCIDNLEWCTSSENKLHKYQVLWYRQSDVNRIATSSILSKPILQYTLEWTFVREWKSWKEAIRNGYWKSIYHCARWNTRNAYWYIWKYKNP